MPVACDVTGSSLVAAYCRADPMVAATGLTAARLWGFPLPSRHATWQLGVPITLTIPRGRHRRSTPLISWQHRALPPGRIATLSELRLTTRDATFLDLGAILRVPELVAIGDHLVRTPRLRYEGRSAAWSTVEALRDAAAESSTRGIARVREALTMVRVGSDSPGETALRLALADAGIPEPELNVPLVDDGEHLGAPDLLWRSQGVCAEYDGRHHLTPEQRRRDVHRAERRRIHGIVEVVVLHEDLHPTRLPAVARIRQALREQERRQGVAGRST